MVIFCVLVLVTISYQIRACRNDCITVGIIANGSDVIETETFLKHGYTFAIIKHLVDTTELYEVFKAVRTLDEDANVDVIVLAEYGSSILTMPQILMTNNKKLIKLGARSTYKQNVFLQNVLVGKTEDELKTSCNMYGAITHDSKFEDVYCIKDVNTTNLDRDNHMLQMPGPRAVRSIVKSLRWRYIVIFYESSTEMEVQDLIDDLSKDGVLFMMFNAEHVKDLLTLLREIYKTKTEGNKDINIVIACQLYYTKKILSAANRFDSFKKQKTLLKKFSRWLTVLYGYHRMASKMIQECVNELDNVAIIAVPELKTVGVEEFYTGIDSIMIMILREKATEERQFDIKTSFINKLQNVESWSHSSTCQAYHIDTLLWTDKGREFSSVGYAGINGNVVLQSGVFPNEKYGYNKRRFLVSTLKYAPFVIKRKDNNTYIYEGFCMDLLNELARKLNFTYDFTEPEDGKWGSTTNSVNVSFNGLIGQLQREEVDIVAAPISVQAERTLVMDASYPYYYEYTTVLVKKPDVNATKWRTLVDPLRWEVLITIGVSLVTVTVLAFLLEKYNPFYDIPEHAQDRLVNGGLHTWHSSFWYVFGALLCQGGVHLPASTTGRTLISCWWLTCTIIVGTYCGNLIAFLTVTKERPPFNTIKEMATLKRTYKWGTIGGTAWEMKFPNSSNPTFRAIGKAFLEFNKTDPTILHTDPAFHVNRVKEGKYAWIGDKTYAEISIAKECSLMSIKEEFFPMIYVFGFTNSSPHAALFSAQMIKINEGGLFQIWKRKWWPKSNFCAGDSVPEAKPISLMDVQSAFYVCFIGIFLGSFAFLVELVVHKYRMHQRDGKVWTQSDAGNKLHSSISVNDCKTTNVDHEEKQTRL